MINRPFICLHKYRLKRHEDGEYTVEIRKYFFFWFNEYSYPDYGRPREYRSAVRTVNDLINKDEIDARKRSYVPQYVYPPLPEKDPNV